MAIKYRGKHLRIKKAKGFRLGFGYIPHYQSNLDISVNKAQSLMVWIGPFIVAWDYRKKGYEPRMPWDRARIAELEGAILNFQYEIDQARRAEKRWVRHINMARWYGMGDNKLRTTFDDERNAED